MGFDGCLLFLPKFLKLFKGLLIILPELPQIPFVPNFMCKESQLGKNRIYCETFHFWAWRFSAGRNTTVPVVLTRFPQFNE